MSLDVSRHLWTARVDPKRRRHAVGTYTHVLDQWGIVYDQPLLLATRQAGAAIEGAVRQSLTRLERLAVDTHGYTDLGMALAKLLGFDLCPRLYSLRDRHLHVPRRFEVPASITDIVQPDVSLEPIRAHWDELLRLVATIELGWRTATDVLERFGSAARGDRIYRAGHALGQLLRTVYLCDYFTLPEFRRSVYQVLERGESVHALQRQICTQALPPKRSRRAEELIATSGALTLVTNCVMAWKITVEVLCAVDAAARDLAIDYFVAGAMARDIVLLNVLGFDTLRATRDIDLAVNVSGWDQFDALKNRLIDSHGFSKGNAAAQRVYYASVYPVDLVPFGGVVENDGSIKWPPDSAIVMNALGYNEALHSILQVEVKRGTAIPVASLASLAMLKVFAWLDRGHRDRKDAQDLALLLRRYADTIDAGDLHSSEAAVLDAVDYDYERAGAQILGKHVQQMAAPQTVGELLSNLQSAPTRSRLAIHMAQTLRSAEDPVELAGQLLGDFITGLSPP